MTRILIGLIVLALLPVAAGCGDNDSSSGSASQKTTDETAAQPAPSDALTLNADEQKQLENARQSFADYCDHKGAKPVGSVAIAESLLTYGADTQTADGTLGDAIAQSRDALRTCGADQLAKRLGHALQKAP